MLPSMDPLPSTHVEAPCRTNIGRVVSGLSDRFRRAGTSFLLASGYLFRAILLEDLLAHAYPIHPSAT